MPWAVGQGYDEHTDYVVLKSFSTQVVTIVLKMYGQNKPTWTIFKIIYYNLLFKLKKKHI